MAYFYFLNICHLHENKQTKKAGRKAPPTHPLWRDSFVQVQTCWQHWTYITKIGTRLRNFGLVFVFKEFMSNDEEIKSGGTKYECSMHSKCWYLSACATFLLKRCLPTHSWSPWHNSSNQADSSWGVNEGMTLEGGSEKSQIKRTSVEVIVTD